MSANPAVKKSYARTSYVMLDGTTYARILGVRNGKRIDSIRGCSGTVSKSVRMLLRVTEQVIGIGLVIAVYICGARTGSYVWRWLTEWLNLL